MKSIIFFAYLIMILLISTMAFGSIEYGHSDNYARAMAACYASGSTNYVENYESGWEAYWTTEAGTFSWEYALTANASCGGSLMLDEWAAAAGAAEAEVSGPTSDSAWESASFEKYGDYDYESVSVYGDDENNAASGSGCSYFSAYSGINVDVDADAVAEIEEGSGCSAWADSDAWGSCGMS